MHLLRESPGVDEQLFLLSWHSEDGSAQCGDQHHEPRRKALQGEQSERDEGERQVCRRLDRAGPDRMVQRDEQKPRTAVVLANLPVHDPVDPPEVSGLPEAKLGDKGEPGDLLFGGVVKDTDPVP